MDKSTFNETPASSLSEQVSVWENQVKEARRKGDPEATLAIATTAADAIEQLIDKQTAWTEDEKSALTAVKRFTFNAAADAWPGWQVDGPLLDTHILTTAKGLAQRSTDWVEKLQLGAIQEGTGVWLIGGFDLALGQFDEALTRFSASSQLYHAASAPGLTLLTNGYEAMARGLRGHQSREDIMRNLEDVITKISSGDFKDGAKWIEQLRTALTVVSKE